MMNSNLLRARRHAPSLATAALALASSLTLPAAALAADTSPAQQLERWSAQAGAPGQAARGRAFFTGRHAGDLSCASCHGNPPTSPGRHASTGKVIDAMAYLMTLQR